MKIISLLQKVDVAEKIKNALKNKALRGNAQNFNVDFVNQKFNRDLLRGQIIKIYEDIYK